MTLAPSPHITGNSHKRVLLVHTGGTLGMALPEERRLDLAPAKHLERLLKRVPELTEIADVELVAPWNLDSSDVGPEHWQQLATLVAAERDRFDGVVIIHGTDTLAYTASALAFMLHGLDKPVVFTGSQRPLEAWRTDARANLAAAVECATLPLPEVLVAFGDKILRACRSTKADASGYTAFQTPAEAPLGRIGVELDVDWPRVRTPQRAFQLETGLDTRVLALTVFPGFDPHGVARALLAPGVADRLRAVIVRGFGVGNVPTRGERSLTPLVEGLTRAGVAVVVGSQCHRPHTDLGMYVGGRALLDAGAIEAHDHTFEATVVKTMWALARPEHDVRAWLARDLAGESTTAQT